jgi:anti-sigma regulatory factor (Ser/Thr protein kinase)
MSVTCHWVRDRPAPLTSVSDSSREVQVKGVLPSATTAPRIARKIANAALSATAVGRLQPVSADCRGDVALVVSELVTNAVLHARGPIEFEVTVDDDVIELRVSDHTPELPKITFANGDQVGGAGLRIVDRLARYWGVEQSDDGKVVWCQLSLR